MTENIEQLASLIGNQVRHEYDGKEVNQAFIDAEILRRCLSELGKQLTPVGYFQHSFGNIGDITQVDAIYKDEEDVFPLYAGLTLSDGADLGKDAPMLSREERQAYSLRKQLGYHPTLPQLAEPEIAVTFNGMTPFEFIGHELYEFQNATGCTTAEEYLNKQEKAREALVEIVGLLDKYPKDPIAYAMNAHAIALSALAETPPSDKKE